MKPMKVLILIEKGETSYGVSSPDVPGCYAIGDTREDALQLMQEAIQAHITFLIETNRQLPMAWVAACMRHVWIMRLYALRTWIRERMHHKEDIAHMTIPLSAQM